MQDYVIEVRYKPFFTHGEDPDSVPEALIIALQFSFAGSKYCEIPVAHKLNYEPEHQNPEKAPFTGRLKAMKRNQPNAVQTQHKKLGTFQAHTLHKKVFSDPVSDGAAQKPYPQYSLTDNLDYHSRHRSYFFLIYSCICQNKLRAVSMSWVSHVARSFVKLPFHGKLSGSSK